MASFFVFQKIEDIITFLLISVALEKKLIVFIFGEVFFSNYFYEIVSYPLKFQRFYNKMPT